MTTIAPGQRSTFARRFTQDHNGWSASLHVREKDGLAETAVDDRPFRGITFESHGHGEAVMLSFGDDPDEHLAHIIEHPQNLVVFEEEEHGQCSLVIGLDDGSAYVLELANPFMTE